MVYLASIGVVKETKDNVYIANNVTKNLAEKATEAGICHWSVDINSSTSLSIACLNDCQLRDNRTRISGVAKIHEGDKVSESHQPNAHSISDGLEVKCAPV